jgi:hypothetical protein
MIREEIVIHGCWDCPCWNDDGTQCNLPRGLYQNVAHHASEPATPPRDCPLRTRSVLLTLETTTP